MTHRAKITASINKYMDKARKLYPNANIPNPTISFNMKGATRLGIARYGARVFEIRINDQIAQKYLDDAINDTAPHEVAHLVAYKVYGRCQGHGPNWKRIMRQFGVPANRLADDSLDTLEFKIFKAKTEYVYTCGRVDCEHKVGPKVHRKLMMGSEYTCQRTGTKLTDATYVRTDRKSAAQRKREAYAKAGKPLPGATKPSKHALPNPKTPMPLYQKAAKRVPQSQPGTSKRERSEALYCIHKGKARPDIIAIFMKQLGMTAAGAATYYANCKKIYG